MVTNVYYFHYCSTFLIPRDSGGQNPSGKQIWLFNKSNLDQLQWSTMTSSMHCFQKCDRLMLSGPKSLRNLGNSLKRPPSIGIPHPSYHFIVPSFPHYPLSLENSLKRPPNSKSPPQNYPWRPVSSESDHFC